MRHVLAGVLFFILACSLLWAALPFTDSFGSADGTTLTSHSANYTNNANSAVIYGGAVGCATVASCIVKVNSETFGTDLYLTGIIKTPYDNYLAAVAGRIGTGDQAYRCGADSNEFRIDKRNSGNSILTQASSPTISDGDEIRFTITGTGTVNLDCELWRGGSKIYDISTTDSSSPWNSGPAGISGYNQTTGSSTTRIDDISLNDYSAGSSAPIRRRPIMMFFTLPEFK